MSRSALHFFIAIFCPLAGLLVGTEARVEETATITLYDNDPTHPWNRLYAALMVRAPEPKAAENDLLDPPYWFDTKDLLDGESNRRAIARLREFVKEPPLPASMSPLSRAVMQRDLLGIFHWLRSGSEWTVPKRELAVALASAIHHVALSEEEIHKLPDNYAVAVAAKDAITTYDSAHPAPFLPKDLLADDGPWLALAPKWDDGLAATFHFQTFYGRSVFEVRMRHPEGRAAGEAYLKELAAFQNPFVKEKPTEPAGVQRRGQWTNPATPQFPVGTMWALVRRAILCDAKGMPEASPLVESVQIRVYRNLGFHSEPETCKVLGIEPAQFYFGWEMRRALLLGKGGFSLTSPEDHFYSDFPPRKNDPFLVTRNRQTSLNCYQCHAGKGIHSVASRMRLFDSQQGDEPLARPPEFRAVNRANIDLVTVSQARTQPGWVLLQWLTAPKAH